MNLEQLLTLGGQGAGAGVGGVVGTMFGGPVGTAVGTTVGAGLGQEAVGNVIDKVEAVADGDVEEIVELVVNPLSIVGLDIPGIPFI